MWPLERLYWSLITREFSGQKNWFALYKIDVEWVAWQRPSTLIHFPPSHDSSFLVLLHVLENCMPCKLKWRSRCEWAVKLETQIHRLSHPIKYFSVLKAVSAAKSHRRWPLDSVLWCIEFRQQRDGFLLPTREIRTLVKHSLFDRCVSVFGRDPGEWLSPETCKSTSKVSLHTSVAGASIFLVFPMHPGNR